MASWPPGTWTMTLLSITQDDEPGLLVVTGVLASACDICEEYWFDDSVGFGLSRLLHEHEPAPGELRTIEWLRSNPV
jgi:hypothetical protein